MSSTPSGTWQAHPALTLPSTRSLTEDEINSFLDDLDHNADGFINYSEIQAKLDAVNAEIAPQAAPHNLHHKDRDDVARHAFLKSMMGGSDIEKLSREEFGNRVRGWNIPSMKQDDGKEDEDYMKNMGIWRRIRSYWSVRGPEIMFLIIVFGSIIGLSIWQFIKYLTGSQYQAAFGWGVALAKACAGALYMTMFFLLLSMSRYFSTFLRRNYYISRFINWDLSQEFHIKMSCLALFLGTLHGISHLSGTFVFGSRDSRAQAVAALLGPDAVPRPYVAFIRSTPGWTGLTALGLFWLIAILSIPKVRKWNYEIFQLGHLLMYPIIGLLMAHGTAGLLQWPMLGYFMAFPTLLIILERATRVLIGFRRIPAKLKVLDSETIEINATIPEEYFWRYHPGQYVFLQVPEISFFQWHPFTVSVCYGRLLTLHIKTDGNWTKAVRGLATGKRPGENEKDNSEVGKDVDIKIGLNGPFGAPAQRFYDYTHTILVGAGIGVTPFSGILADLQAKDDRLHGGPGDELDGGLGVGGAVGQGYREGRSRRSSIRQEADIRQNRQGSSSSDSDQTVAGPESTLVEKHTEQQRNPKNLPRRKSTDDNALTRMKSRTLSLTRSISRPRSINGRNKKCRFADDYRRVDFHWMVRDKNNLSWFSNLLNSISKSQNWHRGLSPNSNPDSRHDSGTGQERDESTMPHLDIRIQTHVTQKRKSISTHIYRWLLELHRTETHPESPLTGLLNPTHFGRPDFVKILDQHYEDLLVYLRETGGMNKDVEKTKVGVFFCGTPVIGEILSDRCRALSVRGRKEGTNVEYHFMMEVFG